MRTHSADGQTVELEGTTIADALAAAGARLQETKDRFARAALTADSRMVAARRAFSKAAAACLSGTPEATAAVRAALEAVDQARGELRRFADQQIEESPK